MCRTYGWPHTQTCILSHSSTSLQTDLTISYNSLVNTNTPTGIKQIRTVYWSALLPRNENFRLVQSSLKQLTTFFLNSQKQIFSKEHNFQEERNMQTFCELLVQTVPLKQVRTKHLENIQNSPFSLHELADTLRFSSTGPLNSSYSEMESSSMNK